MASLKHSTHSVTIEAPFDVAWNYLSEWRNQTEWATKFVLAVRQEGDQIFMTTPNGEVPITWQTNREHGTIDIIFPGDSLLPTRLSQIGDSLLYTFTFSLPVDVPDPVFEQGQANMDEELANLKRIIEARAA
ncbi:MAG: SRPBCC family protein [Chloroflexi bacterium]|nr:MAG: hypothetical protein CUN54_08560 [Phototrophicales bacterium]RMF78164.1 MAG: SRPBCC family protein [Chloroflexota bacterium]